MGIEEQWSKRYVEKLEIDKREWKDINALLESIKATNNWGILGEYPNGPPVKISRKDIPGLLKHYGIKPQLSIYPHSFIVSADPDKPGELKVGALSRAKRESEGIEGHGGFGVARIRQFEDDTRDIVKICAGEPAAIDQEIKMLKLLNGENKVSFFKRDFERKSSDPADKFSWEWIGRTVIENKIKTKKPRNITTKNYIIQPLIEGNELSSKLSSDRMLALNVHQSIDIAIAVSLALKSLHDKDIVHSDLKTQNLMIVRDEAYQTWVAIAVDFGMAFKLQDGDTVKVDRIKGTIRYMAPEINNKVKKLGIYSKASDIYALGIILSHDLSLKHPVVTKMLSGVRNQRPSIDEVIAKLYELKAELSVENYLDQYQAGKKEPSIFKNYRIKTPEQLVMLEQLKQVLKTQTTHQDISSQADQILAILGANQQRHDKTLLATASSFNFKVLKALPTQLHNICLDKLGIEKNQSLFLLKPTKANRQKLAGYLRDYNKLNSQASQPQPVVVSRGPGV